MTPQRSAEWDALDDDSALDLPPEEARATGAGYGRRKASGNAIGDAEQTATPPAAPRRGRPRKNPVAGPSAPAIDPPRGQNPLRSLRTGSALLYQVEALVGEPVQFKVWQARVSRSGYTALTPVSRLDHFAQYPPSFAAAEDGEILTLLAGLQRNHARENPRAGGEAARALGRMLATGRCFFGDESDLDTVVWLVQGLPRPGKWKWLLRAQDGHCRLDLEAEPAAGRVVPANPPWYVDDAHGLCGEVQQTLPLDVAVALLRHPWVPLSKAEAFIENVERHSGQTIPPLPKSTPDSEITVPPKGHLTLYGAHGGNGRHRTAAARLGFDYAGTIVRAQDSKNDRLDKLVDGKRVTLHRQRAQERALVRTLHAATGLEPVAEALRPWEAQGLDPQDFTVKGHNREDAWSRFLEHMVPALERQGWTVETDINFPYRFADIGEWYGELHEEDSDWFGLELGVMVSGQRVNLLPILLEALKREGGLKDALQHPQHDHHFLWLPSGECLKLPAERLRPLVQMLHEIAEREDALMEHGRLQLNALDAQRLADIQQANPQLAGRWQGGWRVQALAQALARDNGVAAVDPPKALHADLRNYQREGLNWLQFLREFDLAGILADDMGLGKTLQALAHIQTELEQGRLHAPALVIAPTSVVSNWAHEAARFAPQLKVIVLTGARRSEHFMYLSQANLVLTSYALLRQDAEVLSGQPWHMVILDEAHNIKNATSLTTRSALSLEARHRICLTGTPLENHLGELWSQFNFLMPGFLGNSRQFEANYRKPIEKAGDDTKRERLARRIAPYILRRTKIQVAPELPPKTETVLRITLEGAQRDLYETLRLALNEDVRRELTQHGLARSHILVLDALLKLRQVCCDPRLLKMESAQKAHGKSAKLQQLMSMLPELVHGGRRILVFSQFTSMLDLIQTELQALGLPYALLTGQTRDRDAEIAKFQGGEVPVFLLSLKAGGVGLNLTAADVVIHYDPWWNPAAEQQATDRAYRIGQDKPVFVYRLIAEGSVEERIQQLQARKAALFESMVGEADGQQGPRFTEDDLAELLRPLGS